MAEQVSLQSAAFGAVVTFLRSLRGWSQEELAAECRENIDGSQISRFEAGKRMPRPPKVHALAQALLVPPGVLYGLQEALLRFVSAHPVDFDALLRSTVSPGAIEEVREPPAGESPGPPLREQWRSLAREQGALKEREILLFHETLMELLGEALRGALPEDH